MRAVYIEDGQVRVWEPVRPLHPIYDGRLGEDGPPMLHMREGETSHAFAVRLTAALGYNEEVES